MDARVIWWAGFWKRQAGLGLAARKCARGLIKHAGRCVHSSVPFSSGGAALTVPGGMVKLRLTSKALRALKGGHTLHVSGKVSFQSALGGAPSSRTLAVVVRPPAKRHKHR